MCYIEIWVSSKTRDLPSETLSQTQNFKKFATARQPLQVLST